MKKVFLYAYLRSNLGDDFFIRVITSRYPTVTFYVWADETVKYCFRDITNIKVINEKSWKQRFLAWLRPSFAARRKMVYEERCDALVYVGGSIFIEYENWENILTWWDYEAAHRNMFVLGANFGPYTTEAYRVKMEEVFSKMKDICFREQYSKYLFHSLPNVRVAPDILFGLPMPKRIDNRKQVFVSLIDCASNDHFLVEHEEKYYQVLYELLSEAVQYDYKIVLSSFCRAEGDEQAVAKFEHQYGTFFEKQCKHCFYDGTNSIEVIQEISNSDFIIGTRFHASILGFAAGKPVLPIVYSDKTIHVLEDAGFEGMYMDIRSLTRVSFSDLVDKLDKQKIGHAEKLRIESELQFKVLDQFLQQ